MDEGGSEVVIGCGGDDDVADITVVAEVAGGDPPTTIDRSLVERIIATGRAIGGKGGGGNMLLYC